MNKKKKFVEVEDFSDFSYDLDEIDKEPEYTGPIIRNSYGPLSKNGRATILNEGPDWFLIKNNGRAIYVPKYVIG
jgi:hypothetical protein